ncbi:hypothetical protein TRICI_004925 [Trichomonascus ciferrii]|uniref:Major facilitator superfamily (MFS) profile domain-containing protein n=1 Tax=Trichomonascus ciferrii TaxID=44093 RepID=A0A642UY64_9ASCO|nr:hypothetical protein TRICI_004925 [Trichomonascus ciferrii]
MSEDLSEKRPGPERRHSHVHGPVAAEIAVPHGVQDYSTVDGELVENDDYMAPSDKAEKDIFQYLLRPGDIYDSEGTYWADMGPIRQAKFVSKVNNQEAKKELKTIGGMIKNDPLSPVHWFFKNSVLPGAGLGLEGYVLFSIGNVSPLFEAVWPQCWKDHETCNVTWVSAVKYLEICGIICGQIIVGLIGDGIGRRFGLIQDAAIMLLGLVMLIAGWGTSLNGWVICYAWSLFIYGIGVGGEYPMTATSGMEKGTNSSLASTANDRLHRGRKVTQAFLMQGWGQFVNQVVLILLLLIFHHGSGNPPYSKVATQWTYRVAFALPAIGTLWLVYYRTYKMPVNKQLQEAKKKSKVTGYDVTSLKLTFKYFGGRLLATTIGWYTNDVFFYGNKLFQGQFIQTLNPGNDSVMVGWLYNLLNVGVSLCGYYLASLTIDNKLYGRKKMQIVGFLMCFVLFVIPAFKFEYYTSKEHVNEFQAMYYLSSFFNQFGPNSVTFLVAAEVYPTPVRATAHGLSAACGQLGSLTAAVLYNYIDTKTKFRVVPWFGLAGMIVTLVFLPDTTGLDLKEQDRRWQFIREGREADYHGIAIHPKHLSLWERMRGVHKNYDPELDHKQKVDEMRKDWLEKQRAKYSEPDSAESNEENDEYTHQVHDYFYRTSPMILPQQKPADSEKMEPVSLPDPSTK